MFVYIGNKNLLGKGGIAAFQYNKQKNEFNKLWLKYPDVSAGYMCIDEEHSRLFCVNECLECDGIPGGQVLCFQIDSKTGDLKLLSRVQTHTVLPCHIVYVGRENHLYVCNHAKRDWSLKLEIDGKGRYYSRKVYDDAVFEVFDVLEDGTINGPTECWTAPWNYDSIDNPHLHSITYDEKGQCFYICDTGCGGIYTLQHDDEGVLFCRNTVYPKAFYGAPRYGVMHPFLPIVYFNSETQNKVYVFNIQEDKMIPIQKVPIFPQIDDSTISTCQSALAIDSGGKTLYTLDRKACCVCVFSILSNGHLQFKQTYPIPFESPRDLLIMPDGKSMLIVCSIGKAVLHVQIEADGSLNSHTVVDRSLPSPSCAVICASR